MDPFLLYYTSFQSTNPFPISSSWYPLLKFRCSILPSPKGANVNNRWWNDRRSWNLRTTNSREKASPKGANHIQSCPCSPPSGTIRENLLLSAGSIPFGHSTRGYSHSPPSGTAGCYLRNLNTLVLVNTIFLNIESGAS